MLLSSGSGADECGDALGGFVFVLDGVLMGAGDARYLAWTSLSLTNYRQ